MQFEVKKSPAKLDSFTPRAELHGDEKIPACSIGITLGVHSSALDQFDKSYRPFLFREADATNDQPSVLPGDKLPDRKTVVEGKSVSVRLDLGGARTIKNKKKNTRIPHNQRSAHT